MRYSAEISPEVCRQVRLTLTLMEKMPPPWNLTEFAETKRYCQRFSRSEITRLELVDPELWAPKLHGKEASKYDLDH